MSIKIYVEGGGDTNALKTKCRQGFSEFFRKAGLEGRMPRVVSSGGRQAAFKDRGKEPMREQEQFPWFWNDGKFTGERVNDVHLTTAKKKTARERAEGKPS